MKYLGYITDMSEWCEYVEHGLEYFSLYVQKHIAHLAACSGSQRLATGTHSSENSLIYYDIPTNLCLCNLIDYSVCKEFPQASPI